MDRLELNPYVSILPAPVPNITLPQVCEGGVCVSPVEGIATVTTAYGSYEIGTVSWQFSNKNNNTTYVALFRGVPGYSPMYFFGGAFGAVYIANGTPIFGENTTATTSWGILHNGRGIGSYTVGFIFKLKPGQTYTTIEYGFPTYAFPLFYRPVIVNPGKYSDVIVFYNHSLTAQYELEAGITAAAMPDPFEITIPICNYDGPYANLGYAIFNLSTTNLVVRGAGLIVKLQSDITNWSKIISRPVTR